MSTVYRGERDDAQYHQTVAIKVLHHSTLHPRLRSRLHSERHILATLDHPAIARLIDSGDLEDGTPYLVMEHVDGRSHRRILRQSQDLFVRERLELFLQVCTAVQYAHRNLVVHRDIKPPIFSSPSTVILSSWTSASRNCWLRRACRTRCR